MKTSIREIGTLLHGGVKFLLELVVLSNERIHMVEQPLPLFRRHDARRFVSHAPW